MRTLEEMEATAQRMQDFLELKIDTNVEEKVIERMELLQVLIAKSGNYLADAVFLQDNAKTDAINRVISDVEFVGSSTSTMNKYIDSAGKDYNRLVKWFDRINSAAGKQHQGLITILSYRKEQMKMV